MACRQGRILIELDGATHSTDEELARDARREAFLRDAGYSVLRFRNSDVYEALDQVCEAIIAEAKRLSKSPD